MGASCTCAEADVNPISFFYFSQDRRAASEDFVIEDVGMPRLATPILPENPEDRIHQSRVSYESRNIEIGFPTSPCHNSPLCEKKKQTPSHGLGACKKDMPKNGLDNLSDNDAKKRIKEALEPFITSKVRELVNHSVDEFFENMSCPQEIISQYSNQIALKSQNDDYNAERKKFNCARQRNSVLLQPPQLEGKSTANSSPSWKLSWNEYMSDDAFSESFTETSNLREVEVQKPVTIRPQTSLDTELPLFVPSISSIRLNEIPSPEIRHDIVDFKSVSLAQPMSDDQTDFVIVSENIKTSPEKMKETMISSKKSTILAAASSIEIQLQSSVNKSLCEERKMLEPVVSLHTEVKTKNCEQQRVLIEHSLKNNPVSVF